MQADSTVSRVKTFLVLKTKAIIDFQLGFHKLDKIRAYRQGCEKGYFGELDAPNPYFNWFYDEEAISKHAVRVPMKQVQTIISSQELLQ